MSTDLTVPQAKARELLDAHTREIIEWHFNPATGCPFWLEKVKELGFDPRQKVHTFEDLKIFPEFQDEWLRGGPVERWIPQGLKGKPTYVFETGGTTGIPKTRVQIDDWKIDYEQFSHTLPDEHFPKGSNWLMLGPSGPRRLRLAVEHLAQYRGGIAFCVDLDPRWVVKVIKRGAMEELLKDPNNPDEPPVYMTPTYGNTLMGLACSRPFDLADNYKISYYAPQPRAVIEVVEFKDYNQVVPYGATGRVKLTTLTKETFIPGFMERDEGERELPCEKYPWDGISGTRPFHEFAKSTTVGVY